MPPGLARSHNNPLAALLNSQVTWHTGAVALISLEVCKCNPCTGICECVCHVHRKVQTPRMLHRLMGNLLVGYAGMSLWKPRCNIPTCRGFLARSVTLTYCFPQWFVARAVHVTWSDCLGGPGLSLYLQRRYPESEENSVFLLANNGNTEGVKELIQNRMIRPNDADAARGFTPLHIRFYNILTSL